MRTLTLYFLKLYSRNLAFLIITSATIISAPLLFIVLISHDRANTVWVTWANTYLCQALR